ncbi:MAG: hypothetical protein KME47_09855 [Nodosilinea sp. WJT8-NPBG4]|jgi:hypothetical protein|nr:hypothetical protein [Nodosilinea sp. WJT8-NPBG4]
MPDKLDFNSLTQTQIDCLCAIAFGGSQVWPKQTLNFLVDKGLIEHHPIRDGVFTTHTYEMPSHVHIQFCEWCSDTYTEGE